MSTVVVPPNDARTPAGCHATTRVGCLLRRWFWRLAFCLLGGLTVSGTPPKGGCVVVANHASHADAPAVLAALPAHSRAVVVAAADYWFSSGPRAAIARRLVSAFGISRDRDGFRSLLSVVPLLRAGGTVVLFPEGSRSRDGSLGEFRSGAARLAAAAGVPLVPVALAGTHAMLPAHGHLRRRPVAVRVGAPVADLDGARTTIRRGLEAPAPSADSALRRQISAFAHSRRGLAVVVAWAAAEAVSWPLLPELLLAVLVVAAPRRGIRLTAVAAGASVVGGLLALQLATAAVTAPQPLTTRAMHATAATQLADDGAAAMRHQPLSGIPYKVYAAEAGRAGVDPAAFAAWSAGTRGTRILLVGSALTTLGAVLRRMARFYPAYLGTLVLGFCIGLAGVVSAWK